MAFDIRAKRDKRNDTAQLGRVRNMHDKQTVENEPDFVRKKSKHRSFPPEAAPPPNTRMGAAWKPR